MACLLLLIGCDQAWWLSRMGIPSIREVPVERVQEWAPRGNLHFVQVRSPEDRAPHLAQALLLGPDETIPSALAGTRDWVMVLASEHEAALRLAARLARAGLPRVAVVTGDLEDLQDLRTASRQDSVTLQPSGVERHPTQQTN